MKLLRELFIAVRFGLVGVLATIIHIVIVWLLLRNALLPTLAANTLAFLVAFCVSFSGNYVWTFRSPGYPVSAMWRFFIVSGSAFVVNTLLLKGMLAMEWLMPMQAAMVSAAVIPLITFLASRLWTFRSRIDSA